MGIRSQRIVLIAVILAGFILGIIVCTSVYPLDFDFDFASVHFKAYWRAPVWVPLLYGLLMVVLLLTLWWQHRKQL